MPSAETSSSPQSAPPARLRERVVAWVRELIQFGTVGALSFVIDMGLFNLLQHGPLAVLAGHPNTANVVSATIATIFSWIANRLWTYRGRTQANVAREALLFAFANIGGVLITQFCLFFSHEVLGLHSPLADNVAAYVVGFALGTAFRFVFYHYIVFTGAPDQPASPTAVLGAVVGGVPATHAGDGQQDERPEANPAFSPANVPDRTGQTRRAGQASDEVLP